MVNKNSKRETWSFKPLNDYLDLLTDYDANGSFADMAANVHTEWGHGYAWYVRVVGQPDIQSFVGAIAGKHGDGLFVTTAKFSQKAKDYANTHHIILIDGERLANLMIEYNFCVSTRKTFEIKAIDTDALAEYQDE